MWGESARLVEGGKRRDDDAFEPLLAVAVPYACHLPPRQAHRLKFEAERDSKREQWAARRQRTRANELVSQ